MTEFDLPLSSYMVAPVKTLLHTERLTAAARALEELGVSGLPIVDGSGRLTGVLERSDLLRTARLRHQPAEGEPRWWFPDLSVRECMQTAVPIGAPTQTLRQCAQRMLDRRLNRVYVLAGDELAGVISTRELTRAVARAGLATAIRELAVAIAEPISADAPLSLASARFLGGSGQPLVVLDAASAIGVFAQAELRACLEADAGLATRLFMDDRVLVLPGELPAHQAAEQAIAAGARYIIANDAPQGHRVLSGSSFAACVAGRAASETLPLPALTLADAGFRAMPIEMPDPVPAAASAVTSSCAAAERRASEPQRGPQQNEPSDSRERE